MNDTFNCQEILEIINKHRPLMLQIENKQRKKIHPQPFHHVNTTTKRSK